jgi:membrane-bound lytic murein transglycosylase D
MSESELREVNNIPPRMKVRAGSSLLVPRSGQRNNDVSEFVADNAQLSLAPDIILKRSIVRARKGDNLARLAQRYGVSAASAAGWNRMSVNERLKAGQRVTLMLPRSAKLASGSAPSRKSAAVSVRKKGREGKATVRAEKRAGKPGKQAKREKPARQSQAKGKRSEVRVAAEGKNGRKARKN